LRYVGRYTGGPAARDGAYHQGAVWPWLMGPFLTAYLRTHRQNGRARLLPSRAARVQVARWLAAFEERLSEYGLGQLGELAEGDPPHRPCGCIAQAWSVAELLRVATGESSGQHAGSGGQQPEV